MSKTLGVTEAIDQIATTFTHMESEGRHASDAYFFLVGAGVSTPQVKLAAAIEQECRSAARGNGRPPSPEQVGSPMQRYSFWLQRAYPNRTDRQLYFRRMIEKRAISAANFRLAHLIMSGHAPRLVVTTNFDDFLTRALTLFGARPIVSDFPESAVRIDPESSDVQILHVHGTYRFYDCCNLDGEISARAAAALPYRNVSWRLGTIQEHRSPIVIGYSGWEQDVLMQSLRSRLEAPGGLPYNLFWFCYRRDAVATLPDFIRDHDDVVIVVPESEPTAAPDAPDAPDDADASPSPETARDGTDDDPRQEPLLEAVTVLDGLNRALGLDEPALTHNPIGFFADHLRDSLVGEPDGEAGDDEASETADADAKPEEDADGTEDVYRLHWTIRQLSSMRELWGSGNRVGESHAGKLQIALIQSALRRSQYEEALDTAKKVQLGELSIGQLIELREALTLAAPRLTDDRLREIAAHDLVVQAGDRIVAEDPEHALDAERDVATALGRKAIAQFRLGHWTDVIASDGQVIERFARHPDDEIQKEVARAMGHRGTAFERLGDNRAAIDSYDELIEAFVGDPTPVQQRRVAMALLAKGLAWDKLGDTEEAIDAYDDLVATFRDSRDTHIRLRVAAGFVNLGRAWTTIRHPKQAIKTYDELIDGYRRDSDSDIQIRVARALANKGMQQRRLGQREEAVATYGDLIETYEQRSHLGREVQDRVFGARFERAALQAQLGRVEEARAGYDELLSADVPYPSETLTRLLERARANRDKLDER